MKEKHTEGKFWLLALPAVVFAWATPPRSAYGWAGLLAVAVGLCAMFASGGSHTAQAFSTANSPYSLTTGSGALSGQFLAGMASGGPTGIVFDSLYTSSNGSAGNIYVADDGGGSRLYRFPSTGAGTPLNTYTLSACTTPVGLTIGGPTQSDLYVACNGSSQIRHISFMGVDLGPVASILGPLDLVAEANGNLIASTYSDGIWRIPLPSGAPTQCALGSSFSHLDGIVIDQPSNILYASDNSGNKIYAVPLLSGGGCGAPTVFASTPPGSGPDGIAIGKDSVCTNTLFVNANDGNIYAFQIPTGSPGTPAIIATGSERGDLVKVSPDGYLFATQNAHVAKIGPPCFTPDQPQSCITIVKSTHDVDPGAEFVFGLDPPAIGFQLRDGESHTYCGAPGNYDLFEDTGASPGWVVSNITCSVTGTGGSTFTIGVLPNGPGVNITLQAYDNVTCTFTNSRATPPPVGGIVGLPVDGLAPSAAGSGSPSAPVPLAAAAAGALAVVLAIAAGGWYAQRRRGARRGP